MCLFAALGLLAPRLILLLMWLFKSAFALQLFAAFAVQQAIRLVRQLTNCDRVYAIAFGEGAQHFICIESASDRKRPDKSVDCGRSLSGCGTKPLTIGRPQSC